MREGPVPSRPMRRTDPERRAWSSFLTSGFFQMFGGRSFDHALSGREEFHNKPKHVEIERLCAAQASRRFFTIIGFLNRTPR